MLPQAPDTRTLFSEISSAHSPPTKQKRPKPTGGLTSRPVEEDEEVLQPRARLTPLARNCACCRSVSPTLPTGPSPREAGPRESHERPQGSPDVVPVQLPRRRGPEASASSGTPPPEEAGGVRDSQLEAYKLRVARLRGREGGAERQ